jgi:hypothetical protein
MLALQIIIHFLLLCQILKILYSQCSFIIQMPIQTMIRNYSGPQATGKG